MEVPEKDADPSLEEKKTLVTNRLQKRDEDRLASVQKRREEKENTIAENETADYFQSNFSKARREIEEGLEKSDTMPKGDLLDHFDSLTLLLIKLQKFLTDTANFLTAHDISRSQEVIVKLQKDVQSKKDTLIPKKKFAFKSKKKVASEGASSGSAPKSEASSTNSKQEIQVEITDCSFADISSAKLEKEAKETTGKDVALARLSDCVVKIFGSPRAIHMDKLVNCTVLTGPVSGSIFIDGCSNTTFAVSCQQLRIHSSTECSFYIHVTSRAIIEDCTSVRFAPYTWTYGGQEQDFALSGLDRSRNSWDDVDDFNWLVNNVRSPNWEVLEESKRVTDWNVF